ncbi:MAG: hypothetical protein P8L47_00430 [Candidatus Marinamargulisbacteria bacterium]|nr:hypothetical protein [Candidatus Marinamargulisbacteria bacterium]
MVPTTAQFSTDRGHIQVGIQHAGLQGSIPLSNPNGMHVITDPPGNRSDLEALQDHHYIFSDEDNDTLGQSIQHPINHSVLVTIDGDYALPLLPINLAIGYSFRDIPNTNSRMFDQRLADLTFILNNNFQQEPPEPMGNPMPILPTVRVTLSQWRIGLRRYIDLTPSVSLYYGAGALWTHYSLRGNFANNGRQKLVINSDSTGDTEVKSGAPPQLATLSSTATQSQGYLETAGLYRVSTSVFIGLVARYTPSATVRMPIESQTATLKKSSMHYTVYMGYAL